jgi:hypothetical protein
VKQVEHGALGSLSVREKINKTNETNNQTTALRRD